VPTKSVKSCALTVLTIAANDHGVPGRLHKSSEENRMAAILEVAKHGARPTAHRADDEVTRLRPAECETEPARRRPGCQTAPTVGVDGLGDRDAEACP
jgi:hypothetical protein